MRPSWCLSHTVFPPHHPPAAPNCLERDQTVHLFQCQKWFVLPLATFSPKLNLASSWHAQSLFACRHMYFDGKCFRIWNMILRKEKEGNSHLNKKKAHLSPGKWEMDGSVLRSILFFPPKWSGCKELKHISTVKAIISAQPHWNWRAGSAAFCVFIMSRISHCYWLLIWNSQIWNVWLSSSLHSLLLNFL